MELDGVRIVVMCANFAAFFAVWFAAYKRPDLRPVAIIPGSIVANVFFVLLYRLSLSWGWLPMNEVTINILNIWANAIFLHVALVVFALYVYEGWYR